MIVFVVWRLPQVTSVRVAVGTALYSQGFEFKVSRVVGQQDMLTPTDRSIALDTDAFFLIDLSAGR